MRLSDRSSGATSFGSFSTTSLLLEKVFQALEHVLSPDSLRSPTPDRHRPHARRRRPSRRRRYCQTKGPKKNLVQAEAKIRYSLAITNSTHTRTQTHFASDNPFYLRPLSTRPKSLRFSVVFFSLSLPPCWVRGSQSRSPKGGTREIGKRDGRQASTRGEYARERRE